jgi:hypothetical protein
MRLEPSNTYVDGWLRDWAASRVAIQDLIALTLEVRIHLKSSILQQFFGDILRILVMNNSIIDDDGSIVTSNTLADLPDIS